VLSDTSWSAASLYLLEDLIRLIGTDGKVKFVRFWLCGWWQLLLRKHYIILQYVIYIFTLLPRLKRTNLTCCYFLSARFTVALRANRRKYNTNNRSR